jgi:hypothetical protein
MKKFCILLTYVLVFISCQEAEKKPMVNSEAEKAVIDSLLNVYDGAFVNFNPEILASCLTEDALCCGTDPAEFWNKQQIVDLWKQAENDTTYQVTLTGERVVKLSADGNSAIAVRQFMIPEVTPMPWRNVIHLVKTDNEWLINFTSVSFIPKNEDIAKINTTFEM